jgi:hypothetical protein
MSTSKKKQRGRLCPACGELVSISGRTADGRAIGSCGDAFLPRTRMERAEAGIPAKEWAPVVREAAAAATTYCHLCDVGFRRVDGIHVGSQRLGMISSAPCDRVFAAYDGNVRPYLASVDGRALCSRSGAPRRFASAASAYAAARGGAPRMWHV